MLPSHPAWGEWIEMRTAESVLPVPKSHPAWGEWIEIIPVAGSVKIGMSHPAWGEWIEIPYPRPVDNYCACLTPHGVSGLKWRVIIDH